MDELPSFKEIQLQWLGNLYADNHLSDNAMRVATYIALKHINRATGTAWPSYQTLAKALGKSVKTIQRAIHELEEANWFTVKRGNGLTHNTQYTPSQTSILSAFNTKQKTVKSVTLSNNNAPESKTNLSDKGGQICLPNLKNINNNIPPLPPSAATASTPETTATQKEKGYNFLNLWKNWPQQMLPNSKTLTEQLFATLSHDNRQKAARYAASYCLNRKLRKEPCLLIPYLKNKLFLEFDNAPPLDRDGYFKITPECIEWSLWKKYIELVYSKKILKNMYRIGFYLSKTRYPNQQEYQNYDNYHQLC